MLNQEKDNKNIFITIVCKGMFEINWTNFLAKNDFFFILFELLLFEQISVWKKAMNSFWKFRRLIFHVKLFKLIFFLKNFFFFQRRPAYQVNATLSKNGFWYCDLCDKRISIRSESKRFISKSHKHKKEYGTVVEEYEFMKPENDEMNSTLDDTIRKRRNKNFLIHLIIDVYLILNLC